ncbi:hypothetical protein [Caballeronia sp. INML2]|uniref:hypothetical protein n=1 Tax=Caballeronia sp. INML2 TaxID=2921748 RepID=UPI00289332DB|nr:hypothetical protein [Caballeronia sp. INML2]
MYPEISGETIGTILAGGTVIALAGYATILLLRARRGRHEAVGVSADDKASFANRSDKCQRRSSSMLSPSLARTPRRGEGGARVRKQLAPSRRRPSQHSDHYDGETFASCTRTLKTGCADGYNIYPDTFHDFNERMRRPPIPSTRCSMH